MEQRGVYLFAYGAFFNQQSQWPILQMSLTKISPLINKHKIKFQYSFSNECFHEIALMCFTNRWFFMQFITTEMNFQHSTCTRQAENCWTEKRRQILKRSQRKTHIGFWITPITMQLLVIWKFKKAFKLVFYFISCEEEVAFIYVTPDGVLLSTKANSFTLLT